MHRKDMRDHMIALLCRPREIESRRQIVALKCLGSTVVSITDVVLSRGRLQFLDDFCKELGLGNEPVIFQTEVDVKAKRDSVLGKGQRPAEVAMWWILGEMLFHFFKFNTLALLIVLCLAENLPYFGKDMDLSLGYNMAEDTMETIQFEYLNMIAAYMLHALAESQSMGKLLHAFKNVRNMDKSLEENAAPTGGTQPILTRETMSYAISLSISCVCFHANNDISKGRASAAYERAMTDLETLSDPAWHSLLRQLLIEYVTLLTNPEGPAPSAPSLTRQEVIERDKARKDA